MAHRVWGPQLMKSPGVSFTQLVPGTGIRPRPARPLYFPRNLVWGLWPQPRDEMGRCVSGLSGEFIPRSSA